MEMLGLRSKEPARNEGGTRDLPMASKPYTLEAPARSAQQAYNAQKSEGARNASAASPAAANSQGDSAQGLMDNFLKMLLAQIKNQDPTNPMDNNQLASQMAQMHVALGVEKLNTTMLGMAGLVNSVQSVSLTSWVGRTVLVVGKPSVSLDGQSAYGFEVPSGADKVTVTFTDEQGKTYTQVYKDVKEGAYKLDLSNADTTPPMESENSEGKSKVYSVSFEASNEDGSRPGIKALKAAKVENVFFSDGKTKLALGSEGSIALGDVVLVE